MRIKGTKLIQIYLYHNTAPVLSITWHPKEPLDCAVYSHCPINDSCNSFIQGGRCLHYSYVTKPFGILQGVIKSQKLIHSKSWYFFSQKSLWLSFQTSGLFMSGNQTLSSFAKIMQSFILMQNLQNLYWIEGGDIFGAPFFSKKCSFWPISDAAIMF